MRRTPALLLAVCLVLAGCASLPTSSAPAPFDVPARDGAGVQFSAEGPADGSDAETLVGDFLLACAAGPQDDYATARLFLSSASARAWQPDTQILVYDTDTAPAISVGAEANSSVDVTVSVIRVAPGRARRRRKISRGVIIDCPSLEDLPMLVSRGVSA